MRQEDGDNELTDAELDEILARAWPVIREQVWLSLPWHVRLAPFRPRAGYQESR